MENPRDAKLSEIRQWKEYRQQLTTMLTHINKRLRKPLLLELTVVENQISRLRFEIRPNGRNRPGQLSKKGDVYGD